MDVVGEVEELLLAVGLSCGVARKEPLRSFTAARLPEPLHAQPDNKSVRTQITKTTKTTSQDTNKSNRLVS